jgi:hypothetical protein
MTYILFQYTLAVLGGASFVFGLLLVGSESFFTFWQDRYWKEKNNEHLQNSHVFYNRYTRGVFQIAIGLTFIYLALFSF